MTCSPVFRASPSMIFGRRKRDKRVSDSCINEGMKKTLSHIFVEYSESWSRVT